jgi:hypothetical protein
MRLLHTSLYTRGGGHHLPISALSLFSLFAANCTKLTPLFSYSSTLFKKERLPKPFTIKLFRTLSQNTRGEGANTKFLQGDSCSSMEAFGTTLNTYAHVIPDSQIRAVEGVTKVLFSNVLELEEYTQSGKTN